MLLQSLVDQAQHLKALPVEGYARRTVRWAIELDGEGGLRLPHLLDLAGDEGDATRKGLPLDVPDIQRSGTKASPFVAVDRLEYVLGVPKDPAREKQGRTPSEIGLPLPT